MHHTLVGRLAYASCPKESSHSSPFSCPRNEQAFCCCTARNSVQVQVQSRDHYCSHSTLLHFEFHSPTRMVASAINRTVNPKPPSVLMQAFLLPRKIINTKSNQQKRQQHVHKYNTISGLICFCCVLVRIYFLVHSFIRWTLDDDVLRCSVGLER